MINNMNSILRTILLTIVLYALDVIICGSIIGFIYVLVHFSSNILSDTNYDLTVSYFEGLVVYWVFDTIVAKFRETYKMALEYKRDEK